MKRKYGFGLVSERDPGFVIGQVYYLPFYNAAFVYIQVHFFLFQHFIHVFHNKNTSSMIQSGVDAPAVMPTLH